VHDLVTLTTDYGLHDPYVGICHGVVHSIAPHVRIIDVSHGVAPGDVRGGAIVLEDALPAMPVGIHVGVVDPGVGTGRRPIAIGTARGDLLVGPDNGLLAWAADALGGASSAVTLDDARWHRDPVSATFHGRDVFVPVAAHLAAGVRVTELGQTIDPSALVVPLALVLRSIGADELEVEVRAIDRFGNVQLAARQADLSGLGERISVNGRPARRARTFAVIEPGQLGLVEDASGRVAVVVNRGRASDQLDVGAGDLVRLTAA